MQDILASVKWYLIVVLSCISWWLIMLSILSHACWPAVCLWKNFVQILCPFFTAHVLIRLYAFWCWCVRSLYILDSNPLSNTLFAIIFSYSVQFSCSVVWLFMIPWPAVCQASLSITNSWSLLKLMSIESVMPFNHPILCHPLLLLPSVFPSIRILGIQ